MMDWKLLIPIIILGIGLIVSLVSLLIALFRGNMKAFIVEKMAEADSHADWTKEQKKKICYRCF